MPGALVVSCYCLSHGGISEEEGLRGEVGGGGLAVTQGSCCRCREDAEHRVGGGGSRNNEDSQTGSAEEGTGGNEKGRHSCALWNL